MAKALKSQSEIESDILHRIKNRTECSDCTDVQIERDINGTIANWRVKAVFGSTTPMCFFTVKAISDEMKRDFDAIF